MAQGFSRRTLYLILADVVVILTAALAALLLRLGSDGANTYIFENDGWVR